MKKFIIISVLLIINNISFTQTHIPGGDVSGSWTIEGSPYIIDGHINVPVDSTLIIEPGVNIFFPEQNHFRVYGRLIAEGTESDTISFTASDTTDTFAGLYFCETDTSFQDSSKMSFCKFDPGCVSFNNSSCAVVKNSIVTNGYGIGFNNSSPILIDVTISNNTSQNYGGGISCTDSSCPSLVNVTIIGNSATWGGGISCRFNSNPTLENVNIINNSAIGAGGGIFCEESSPILDYLDVIENHVSNGIGGGIHFYDNSNPDISNVNIENNSAYWGGGIGCTNSSPILTNVIISGNSGVEFGGGIYSDGTGPLLLQDVIIKGNSVQGLGGGLSILGAEMIMVNSIVADNYADEDAGGIFCEGDYCDEAYLNLTNVTISENNIGDEGIVGGIGCACECDVVIVNSILWNNEDIELFLYGGCTSAVTYSDIQEGWQGTGNIDMDPMFSDGEFHLSEDSPCIDTGNPDSLYYDIEDPYSPGYALYPAMGTILNDMGAYGGHGYYGPPVAVDDELILNQNLIQLNNYPNPFNPSTTIQFSNEPVSAELRHGRQNQQNEQMRIEIFNIKGQKVKEFLIVSPSPGHTLSVTWDAENHASGIYLYRIRTDDFISEAKKMILIR
jgi:predicted outer membrane repeat protein